jgi:NAD(P) transhydrogenase subunit alpha
MIPILAMSAELTGLFIFVLAAFVGFEVITKVPATLHTPLMSGSNAISGIILVGAILVASKSDSTFGMILGLISIFLATINVVGGFLVTNRMLVMFKKKPNPKKKDGGAA